MLFSLTNLSVSVPNLLHEFNLYGALSNLKMYFSKSEVMGVGTHTPIMCVYTQPLEFEIELQIRVHKLCSKISGHICPQVVSYLLAQFLPTSAKTCNLLEAWHRDIHLWFGHCNLIKMSLLQKFLCLFQALPIAIPCRYFKQVHSLFIDFIWARKRPRLPH